MVDLNALKNPEPGDWLMFRSKTELAKLIAWSSDGIYSHVAVAYDKTTLIEASVADGVRKLTFDEKRAQADKYEFAHIWRSTRVLEHGLPEPEALALRNISDSFYHKPYPSGGDWGVMGLAVTIRQKVPKDPRARYLVRIILDLLVSDDSDTIACSELAYRIDTEGTAELTERLKPTIPYEPFKDTAFPDIDWYKLWLELKHVFPNSVQSKLARGLGVNIELPPVEDEADPGRGRPFAPDLLNMALFEEAPSETEFRALLLQAHGLLKERYGHQLPNPKMVTPGDLSLSPSYVLVGRFI